MSDGYSWTEKTDQYGPVSGSWRVAEYRGQVHVSLVDCGCCGDTDAFQVSSVEEFDKEWKRIGKELRTHVRRAVKRSE